MIKLLLALVGICIGLWAAYWVFLVLLGMLLWAAQQVQIRVFRMEISEEDLI